MSFAVEFQQSLLLPQRTSVARLLSRGLAFALSRPHDLGSLLGDARHDATAASRWVDGRRAVTGSRVTGSMSDESRTLEMCGIHQLFVKESGQTQGPCQIISPM